MKTIKSFFRVLFISVLFISVSNGQNVPSAERTSFNLARTIEFNNETQKKEIKIEVNEKNCRFNLKITSRVHKGDVKIEIYDPKGKKHANLSVGCQIDSEKSNEVVNGMIAKNIDNPELGDWMVKILPTNANAKVNINFSQDVIKKNTNN